MTDACVPYGWGLGPYGQAPWGGSTLALPGGPIPTYGDFNIYCVGPCGQMSVLDTYLEVQEYAQSGQIVIVPTVLDFELLSGGAQPTDTARIFVDKAVPGSWTFDATFKFQALPSDFVNLTERHCFIGTADDNGYCAGLFFSSVGIGYTGSVRYDMSGNLLLNSTFQVLPSSLGIVAEGTYYTVRVVLDSITETTFVYITETAQLPVTGHQLRYILPAIPSSSCVTTPQDGTTISVRGTASEPSVLDIGTLCLGTGVIIPNLPPVADAGVDQAARFCTIVKLDGSRSYDPEGVAVSYNWRLIDGPETSSNVVVGHDGSTLTPVPYTNRFYSDTLSDFHAALGIANNDVLLLDDTAYDIIAVGVDGNGFYVQTYNFALPANLVQKNFKLLRQNAINGRTTVQPTFYPDVVGLYKFDLVVFDGNFNSAPSISVVNVVESAIARGCVPDLSFLWSYLSNFWRLVENKEVIETFWSAVAQVTASELLALWQHEYGKSLRDIQRTFQRKWLHYDLFLQDPVAEQSTTRVLYAGVLSDVFTGSVSVAGKTVLVSSPLFPELEVRLQGTTFTASQLQAELQRQLRFRDARFTVDLQTSGSDQRLLVRAPFPFLLESGSTLGVFTYPVANDLPRGTAGAGIGVDTYRVSKRLENVGIQEGDYLILDTVAYRIQRVVDDSSDTWGYQRLVLSDPLPTAPSTSWVIAGPTTSKYVDFYTALVGAGDTALFEVIDVESNDPFYTQVPILSAASFRDDAYLFADVSGLYEYFSQPDRYTVFFFSVYRHKYLPISPYVVEVPTLQELIKNSDEQAILRQNIDYFVEEYRGQACLRFVANEALDEPNVWQHELPPRKLWAETTYLDNRPTIEANFGIPAEFTLDDLAQLPDSVDYLSVVRGLWYSHFNGPTLYNLRVGTQILLGLPFAEENGTITELRTDFSATQGRILIQDALSAEIVRSYTYPRALELEVNSETGLPYAVGDTVSQFSPLVQGVVVTDYVKESEWFEGYLSQGVFFEVEKFFKFLVRVDSAAFSFSTLLFAKSFVQRIKPTYTEPLFIVRRSVGNTSSDVTDVDVTDTLLCSGSLLLFDMPAAVQGLGGIIDDPDPSGGGWQSQLDSGYPVYGSPTYPTPSGIIPWGSDKNCLSPEDFVLASACITLGAPTLPTLDSIYGLDSGLFTGLFGVFGKAGITAFTPSPGLVVGFPQTATGGFSIEEADVEVQVSFAEPLAFDVKLVINVNGLDVSTTPFTIPAGTAYEEKLALTPVPIVLNDVVVVRLEAQGASALPVTWATVAVKLGTVYAWAIDVPTPAGTYCTYKLM